jgi:oxepin-CoA hydrolase/3-oxo-5,6-dehydrosuberyl-CoA semialdehyde dehydrogenase
MVQKRSPFKEITRSTVDTYLKSLTEESKAAWGMMSAQHMVEHMEMAYRIASGEIQDFEIATAPEHLDKVVEMVYNHKPMPRLHGHPLMQKDQTETLQHADLATAKQKMLEAWERFEVFFKANPEAKTKNAVFGELDKFEWDLLNVKHWNHHLSQFGIL